MQANIPIQCHVVPEETLQRLSMLVDVATNNLKRSVYTAAYVLDDSNISTCTSLRLSETLIAVINNVYEVNSLARRLLFWLDRQNFFTFPSIAVQDPIRRHPLLHGYPRGSQRKHAANSRVRQSEEQPLLAHFRGLGSSTSVSSRKLAQFRSRIS